MPKKGDTKAKKAQEEHQRVLEARNEELQATVGALKAQMDTFMAGM
jgi:hypothetical protein